MKHMQTHVGEISYLMHYVCVLWIVINIFIILKYSGCRIGQSNADSFIILNDVIKESKEKRPCPPTLRNASVSASNNSIESIQINHKWSAEISDQVAT